MQGITGEGVIVGIVDDGMSYCSKFTATVISSSINFSHIY